MDGPALRLTGLTSRARGRRGSLDGLTVSPEAGRLTAVLGMAGSGKSALIRALAGFEPVSGAIELDGVAIHRLPAHRRGFGVVLQPDALLGGMTLGQNVAYPLRLRRVPAPQRARLVAEALDAMLLQGLGDVPAQAASPAQRQRALLARATVFAPRLLLLDEPADAQNQADRAALLLALRRTHTLLGCTTLMATASGADALAVADRVMVLRDGGVTQHGTAEEVFDRPRNTYVAGLLGETNRLPARVIERLDDTALLRLDCGPQAEALCAHNLEEGDACVLTLRPDRVAVAAARATELGDGAIDATLIEARFTGDSYRLRLLIGTGAEVVVRRAAAAGLRGLKVGGPAAIAWQPHHASAFRPGNDQG